MVKELKYDPELPYAFVGNGRVHARFADKGTAYEHKHRITIGEVIDTTPKPKIPEDADYLIWELDGETLMAYRDGGEWFGNGEYWTDEQIAEEVQNAEVTVLVPKESE